MRVHTAVSRFILNQETAYDMRISDWSSDVCSSDLPFAFLWRLRPALRRGGQVIVVDGDRPIAQHGTPFRLLVCEFQAVGYKLLSYDDKQTAGGYLARFVPAGKRPEPADIKVCRNP